MKFQYQEDNLDFDKTGKASESTSRMPTTKVAYLGICFLVLLTIYNSIEKILVDVYSKIKYDEVEEITFVLF